KIGLLPHDFAFLISHFVSVHSPASHLRSRGLEPLPWDSVLRRIEARLGPAAPEFARLHRAFVAYPAEHTARAFYYFSARSGLHDLLACHRFNRLVAIAEALAETDFEARRVLDFGAGGGFLAGWLRDVRGADVTVADLSPKSEALLEAAGFQPLRNAKRPRFDIILCADSLGEIHADEDDWLSDPDNADAPDFSDEVEARYGF